jgi:hypothetical protein
VTTGARVTSFGGEGCLSPGLAAALSVVRSLLRLLLGVQCTPPVKELDALVRGSSCPSLRTPLPPDQSDRGLVCVCDPLTRESHAKAALSEGRNGRYLSEARPRRSRLQGPSFALRAKSYPTRQAVIAPARGRGQRAYRERRAPARDRRASFPAHRACRATLALELRLHPASTLRLLS